MLFLSQTVPSGTSSRSNQAAELNAHLVAQLLGQRDLAFVTDDGEHHNSPKSNQKSYRTFFSTGYLS